MNHFTTQLHIVYYVTNTVERKGVKDMQIWQGLFLKERLLMKGWFYATIIFMTLLTFIFPLALTLYFSFSLNEIKEGFTAISLFWFILVLFIPVIILTVSLGKEVERPDIWLHSRNTIFTLFGVKAVFASVVGAVNILISAIFIILLYTVQLQPFRLVLEEATLHFWLLFLISIFFLSIILMVVGLLFRVIYLILRPYTRKMTGLITLGLLFLFAWFVEKISASSIYQKVSTFGKIGDLSASQFYLGDESSYLWIDASLFYVGEILLNIGFASLLFIVAALLFEKKVRL